ncbi:MAG: isochorismate synthase, partial [Nocardioidaceae bacterium]
MTSVAAGAPRATPLVVRSVAIADPGPLLSVLPRTDPLAWVRRGEGLVGWGVADSVHVGGADRFAQAEDWWRSVTATAVVRDEVGLPGSGLVAFGSFAFADRPG